MPFAALLAMNLEQDEDEVTPLPRPKLTLIQVGMIVVTTILGLYLGLMVAGLVAALCI